MTTDEIMSYYADLLPLNDRGKFTARATIKALVRPLIRDQLALAAADAYNLDDAVGKQLDIIGQRYAGISRVVTTITFGQVTLSDDDYRMLIQMKLALNIAHADLASIDQILVDFFAGVITVHDYGTMRLSYTFNAGSGSQLLAEAFVGLGLFPKPMGVQLSELVYVTPLDNIFGFRTAYLPSVRAKGFNTVADYHSDYHWLNRDDGIPTV